MSFFHSYRCVLRVRIRRSILLVVLFLHFKLQISMKMCHMMPYPKKTRSLWPQGPHPTTVAAQPRRLRSSVRLPPNMEVPCGSSYKSLGFCWWVKLRARTRRARLGRRSEMAAQNSRVTSTVHRSVEQQQLSTMVKIMNFRVNWLALFLQCR